MQKLIFMHTLLGMIQLASLILNEFKLKNYEANTLFFNDSEYFIGWM